MLNKHQFLSIQLSKQKPPQASPTSPPHLIQRQGSWSLIAWQSWLFFVFPRAAPVQGLLWSFILNCSVSTLSAFIQLLLCSQNILRNNYDLTSMLKILLGLPLSSGRSPNTLTCNERPLQIFLLPFRHNSYLLQISQYPFHDLTIEFPTDAH